MHRPKPTNLQMGRPRRCSPPSPRLRVPCLALPSFLSSKARWSRAPGALGGKRKPGACRRFSRPLDLIMRCKMLNSAGLSRRAGLWGRRALIRSRRPGSASR